MYYCACELHMSLSPVAYLLIVEKVCLRMDGNKGRRPSPLSWLQSTLRKSESVTSGASAGSPKSPGGNLAFLASRRGSKESINEERKNQSRRQSNFLELPPESGVCRQRIRSLPSSSVLLRRHNRRRPTPLDLNDDDEDDELYRLRSFNITQNNTVVNCGDSFIPIVAKSSHYSNSSRGSVVSVGYCGSDISSNNSLNSFCDEEERHYRVILVGHSSVGKSALVSQFMTSEYINTYDVSLDDEFGERRVSVQLDGEESELTFIDHPSSEMSAENSLSTYDPHGCIVVYSVTDKQSFQIARDILRYFWQEGVTQEKAVILVANKSDLERAREVSFHEGKSLASSHDAKFIETSSGIQHNVDELLVGTLKQCRLREERFGSRSHLAREIIGKLCFISNKSKSCQNLHVL